MPNKFDELVKTGEFVGFYGVNENCFKIGRYVFEAIEDECDGYRSCMREMKEIDRHERDTRHLHFFKNAVASVCVKESTNFDGGYGFHAFDGWQLVDADGHVWLTFGTDNNDDYYPSFTFYYVPKK